MKLRTQQQIAVQAEMADIDGNFTRDPSHVLLPILLPGGVHAEHNRVVYLETLQRAHPDTQWRARIIYRWRSKRHLMRWKGNFFWRR